MADTIPITPAGYEKLKEEVRRMKTVDRPTVIQEIADARALGDLSENAEYHAAREKQAFLESKISDIEGKLSRTQVIPTGSGSVETVVFGASVKVRDVGENARQEEKIYRIVGPLEADLKNNAISIESPLGRALLKRSRTDVVEVGSAGRVYEIVDIRFDS